MQFNEGTTFLFQGDSITDGGRGRTEDPNHILGHGYVFAIASRMGVDYSDKNYKFINKGISAEKSIDLYGRWEIDTIDLKPDVINILVGRNDKHIKKYETIYRLLIEQSLEELPGVKLILCEPFLLPVGKIKENWDQENEMNLAKQQVVRQLAKEFQTLFVPLQEVFYDACKKAPCDYWIWDGVHPTVPGHELIARKWMDVIIE